MRAWIEPAPILDAEPLAAALSIHPLTARILARRGFGDAPLATAFLDPDYYRPQPPEALPGISTALPLVQHALQTGQPVLVWGDFDVDGQSATAVLVQALNDLGGSARGHIPVRAQEGHGVDRTVLARFLDAPDAPRLLITCDTGIAAFEAVELARSRGVTVIITDHHELARGADGRARLPAADAIVSPRLLPGAEPLSGEAALRHHPLAALPGVGVAYKLVEGLYEAAGRPEAAEDYLDLAALGIVADVALLTGDTRYLLQRGLQRLRQTPRPGLQAMFTRANLDPQNLTEEHIAFMLAPRLNALGRLSDANPALELLTTPDVARARLLALQLEGLNARRQLLTSQTLQAALKQIEAEPALLEHAVLLLAHPAWEPGIIGIVAGRLVERFGKPAALVAAPPDGPARGSARSTPGVDITAALASQAALLERFGGHALAAGFTLDPRHLPQLRRGLSRAAAEQLGRLRRAGPTQPGARIFDPDPRAAQPLEVDTYLDWQALTPALAEEMERLAPFGPGNPPPVFVTRGLRVVGRSALGREQEHLALRVEDETGLVRRMMWWGGVEFAINNGDGSALPEGPLEVAYTLRAAAYRGGRDVQLEWLDYRIPAETAEQLRPVILDDHRRAEHPLPVLERWLTETRARLDAAGSGPAEIVIWAEGEAKSRLAERLPAARLVGRDELGPCAALAIWTIPPSAADLAAALERTRPQRIALFAVDPGMDQAQAFLERLTGAARYAITRKGGQAALAQLAAATAQREAVVRKALDWMAKRGILAVEIEAGEARLTPGQMEQADPRAAAACLEQLGGMLSETRAFRDYYAQTENTKLLVNR